MKLTLIALALTIAFTSTVEAGKRKPQPKQAQKSTYHAFTTLEAESGHGFERHQVITMSGLIARAVGDTLKFQYSNLQLTNNAEIQAAYKKVKTVQPNGRIKAKAALEKLKAAWRVKQDKALEKAYNVTIVPYVGKSPTLAGKFMFQSADKSVKQVLVKRKMLKVLRDGKRNKIAMSYNHKRKVGIVVVMPVIASNNLSTRLGKFETVFANHTCVVIAKINKGKDWKMITAFPTTEPQKCK